MRGGREREKEERKSKRWREGGTKRERGGERKELVIERDF